MSVHSFGPSGQWSWPWAISKNLPRASSTARVCRRRHDDPAANEAAIRTATAATRERRLFIISTGRNRAEGPPRACAAVPPNLQRPQEVQNVLLVRGGQRVEPAHHRVGLRRADLGLHERLEPDAVGVELLIGLRGHAGVSRAAVRLNGLEQVGSAAVMQEY